tara:strand:- start:178662 stop:178979 length:318 start_codon:yes stop_codon:yes gene_type:complete
MNKREIGDDFEEQVAYDLGMQKTNMSGAKFDNGDLVNKETIVECKVKGKPGFQACGSEVKKVIAQAKKHSKEWLYIQQSTTDSYVVLDYNYFLELWTNSNNGSKS